MSRVTPVPTWTSEDKKWMRRALQLAAKGFTPPNPMVGCVLVKDGQSIAEGYHTFAGQPHGEAAALIAAQRSGVDPRGATAYLNLEPCSHYGRTPPCADALISAGVTRVVASMTDPNAKVSGNGFEKLRQAGIRVDVGLLEPEARKLNEAFIHFHTTGLPHITLKVAATLDGKIATRTGESKWITGDKARLFVHILRGQSSAIMVGVGTVIADDPSLRCRLPRVPRQPLRVVLDPTLRIPHNCQLVNSACDIPTLVVHGKGADPAHIDILQSKNVELLAVELSESGLDLYSLFAELARRQIVSVLVEGGSYTSSTLLRGGFVDRLLWFIAPKLLGGQESIGAVGGLSPEWINDALALDQLQARRFGDDLLLETRPKRLPSVVR